MTWLYVQRAGCVLFAIHHLSALNLHFFSSLLLLMLVLSCSNLLMDEGLQFWHCLGFNLYTGVTFSFQQAIINVNDQVYGSFLHDISISGAFVGILLAFSTMQILIQGNLNPAEMKSCFIHQVFMLAPWQAAIHYLCNEDTERLTVLWSIRT